MNASISPEFRFGAVSKSMDVGFSSSQARKGTSPAALTNAEYLRQSCAQMRIGVGPRDHVECPYRVTFDRFSISDGEALRECIDAVYQQSSVTRISWPMSVVIRSKQNSLMDVFKLVDLFVTSPKASCINPGIYSRCLIIEGLS